MKQKLPEQVLTLLWDVDISQIDIDKHQKYIIERIVEYGDIAEIKWMQSVYSREQISRVVSDSKRISRKAGDFFAFIYKLDRSKVRCLQMPYIQKQNRF